MRRVLSNRVALISVIGAIIAVFSFAMFINLIRS